MKNNQLNTFQAAITAGVEWIRTPNNAPLRESDLPACATSDTADAFLIAIWGIYWGHGEIEAIRRSRGHSWCVVFSRSVAMLLTVCNPTDHRDGVQLVLNRT
jgi:hypothetical protein